MRARQTRTSLVAVVLTIGALAAQGCGSDDGATATTTSAVSDTQATQPAPPTTTTGPVASTPDATPPAPPTVTDIPTSTTPAPPSNTTPTPEEEQGGGGEESIRVPAAFAIRGGALTPPQVTVPPRLAVELSVRSDGQPHTIVLRTPEPQTLRLEAGTTGSVRMPGLRAGTYEITLDGRPAGQLIAGGEVGP